MTRIRATLVAVILAGSTWSLAAHHTISTVYDVTQRVTLTGVVTTVDWKLPHSFFTLDVRAANGGVLSWQIETQAPYVLRRRLPNVQDVIKPNDTVTATVCVAKDGENKGWLRDLSKGGELAIDLSGAGGC